MIEGSNFFIEHVPKQDLPENLRLYEKLSLLKSEGERSGMQSEVISFINGDAPYWGTFVVACKILHQPFSIFHRAYEEYSRAMNTEQIPDNKEDCLEWMTSLHPEIPDWMAASEQPFYQMELERVWQIMFALKIVEGYEKKLLDDMTKTLIMHHILVSLNDDDFHWNHHTFGRLMNAEILLPESIFPIPPRLHY